MRRSKVKGQMLIRQLASADELLYWINSYVIEDFDVFSPASAKVLAVLRLTNFHKKEIVFFEKRMSQSPSADIRNLIECLVSRGSYRKGQTVFMCLIFEDVGVTSVLWIELDLHGVIFKNANSVEKAIDLTGFLDFRLRKSYFRDESGLLKFRHILATERAKKINRRVIVLGDSRKVFKGAVVDGLIDKFCRERFSAFFGLYVKQPSKLELCKVCRPQDLVVYLTHLDGRILLRDSGGRYYWILEQTRLAKNKGAKSILVFAGDFMGTRRKKETEGVSYFASEQVISRLETQEAYLATAFKNVFSIGSEVDDDVSSVLKDVFDQGLDPESVFLAEDWTFLLGSEAKSIWDSCDIVRISLPATIE